MVDKEKIFKDAVRSYYKEIEHTDARSTSEWLKREIQRQRIRKLIGKTQAAAK